MKLTCKESQVLKNFHTGIYRQDSCCSRAGQLLGLVKSQHHLDLDGLVYFGEFTICLDLSLRKWFGLIVLMTEFTLEWTVWFG